jgi:hypothetical protein
LSKSVGGRTAWIAAATTVLAAIITGIFSIIKPPEDQPPTGFARSPSSAEELTRLLDFRAEKALLLFEERLASASGDTRQKLVQGKQDFQSLYKRHLDALRSGNSVLAREILNSIHKLLANHEIEVIGQPVYVPPPL